MEFIISRQSSKMIAAIWADGSIWFDFNYFFIL
jgi:hypothetical protein